MAFTKENQWNIRGFIFYKIINLIIQNPLAYGTKVLLVHVIHFFKKLESLQ